jgi:hypothetical protein
MHIIRVEVAKQGKEMEGLRKKIHNLEHIKLTLEKDKVRIRVGIFRPQRLSCEKKEVLTAGYANNRGCTVYFASD